MQEFGWPYPGKAQQPQEQRYPFLSVCVVFSCVQTIVWLPLVPVFGIFNVHTDVDACDCTRGLYGHRKKVCTGSWPWEKKPCRYGDSNPRQYCAGFSFGRSANWAILASKNILLTSIVTMHLSFFFSFLFCCCPGPAFFQHAEQIKTKTIIYN